MPIAHSTFPFYRHHNSESRLALLQVPIFSCSLSTAAIGKSLHLALLRIRGMDTSNPAVLVNGELLGRYIGRKVRAVIQVIRSDGEEVTGKSADDRQLVVKGTPPTDLSNFVEVIGIADSGSSITADRWTNFGDTFDASSHNKLCQLANGEFQHMFL